MTTCNGCGGCCVVLTLGYPQSEVASGVVRPEARERRFILEELVPISARQAFDRAPWLHGTRSMPSHPRTGFSPLRFYYRCTNYDEETRRCMDWENRPAMCRSFPTEVPTWPSDNFDLPPACSFNADIGRPVAPMPVTLGQTR